MLLWIWQALFPISATVRHDPIGPSPACECASLTICSRLSFLLLNTLGVRIVREFECRIILRSVLLERHTDRNLTLWKLEVMQISRHDLCCSLHAHLDTDLNALLPTITESSLICCLHRFALLIYLTHNANIIGTFRGYGNTFLRLFSLYFHFTP